MTAPQNLFARLLSGKKSHKKNTTKKKMSHKDLFTDSAMAGGSRSYMVMPGQPVWMDRNYPQFALEAYVRNVIAHRAMGMVGGAAASVKLKMFSVNSKGVRKEIKADPVLDLLAQPNPTHAKASFFQALYSYLMISGNAYVQAVGPKGGMPLELHLLRPDRMSVIAGKGCLPAGYRYTINGSYTDYPVDRITGRAQILHLKNFHPLNDWYGLSAVEAAAYSIDQHNQAGAWNQALLQNGARPSGALVVRADAPGGGTLNEDQYSRVKMQIDEQFSGAANAGRPILLEGGLDWREMSLTPKDMDFIEAKNSSARDIALAFGVPPQLLGIPGDNTYSNLQEARLALWEQTVIPLVSSTVDSLNKWLLPMFGESTQLAADTDSISALAIRNQAIWDRVSKASFLTEDEKRAAVGYGPLANGAQILPQNINSKTILAKPRNGRAKSNPVRVNQDDNDSSDDGGDSWYKGYNPDEPRDDHGRWTGGGGNELPAADSAPDSRPDALPPTCK